jgi:hypothetical protein
MEKPLSNASIFDAYRFPGFVTRKRVKEREGDVTSLVITLTRRQKKRYVARAEKSIAASTIVRRALRAISPAAIAKFISNTNVAALNVRPVA